MEGPPRAVAEGLPVLSGTSLPCTRGRFLPPSLASRGGRRFWHRCKRSQSAASTRAPGDLSQAAGAAGGTAW